MFGWVQEQIIRELVRFRKAKYNQSAQEKDVQIEYKVI